MACRTVSTWVVENVLVPVARFITRAEETCQEVKERIEERVEKPVEEWVEREERKCKRRKCKRWCACCNKWLCWIATVVVRVVTWVVVTVVKWVTHLVCKVVVVVVGTVVALVLKVITRLVTFVVCLFTDPAKALSAIWDLFNDVVDAVEDLLDLVLGIVDDIGKILGDVRDVIGGLGRSFCIFGDAMCSIFGAIFGFFAGLLTWLIDVVDWIHDTLAGVVDLLMGILSLDWCRIQKALGILNVVRVITSVTRLLGMAFYVGPKAEINREHLRRQIDAVLSETFADDETRLERSRARVGIDGRLDGVPMTILPYRMAIRSSEFLRDLHREHVLDLYAVAGRFTGCRGKAAWKQFEGEVVYTGTSARVSKTDLDDFVRSGPEAVPSFTVYPIKTEPFRRRLELCERKGHQVGIDFSFDRTADVVITEPRFVPLQADEADGAAQLDLLGDVGRTGTDDLSDIPLIAIFGYKNADLHGLASSFRSSATADVGPPSGTTFRDRFPELVFQFVPIHEVGHYLGLDHGGHTHPGEIMWKPALGTEWGPTLLNYLLTTGEANFTDADIDDVWDWITTVPQARDDILP